MSASWEVEKWVEYAAMTTIKRFYPTYVSKIVETSLEEVYRVLLGMVDAGKLSIQWEIRCPECFSTIKSPESYSLNEEISCSRGDEFVLSSDHIFPAFEIADEYREFIKSKNSTEPSTVKKKPQNKARLALARQ